MQLLFLAQRIPFPANKGEKIRTFNQIKFLAQHNNKIIVLSPIETAQDVDYSRQLEHELLGVHSSQSTLSNKHWRLLKGIFTGEALSIANFYSKELQYQLDRHLKHNPIDAIFCTSSAMAKYLFESKTLNQLEKKPKLIMDFMDLDSDKWGQYEHSSSIPMKWVYQREKHLIAEYEEKIKNAFDACFFISPNEVELFEQLVGETENIHVLGNGLCQEEFYPAKQPKTNPAPVFIFTGVMDYKPNIDAVIWFVQQCWPSILQYNSGARFIIAGMSPTAEVKALEKHKGIEVTGFVEDILPYYHKADYFVAPFRMARGVQNKILQAFACGLPVISTSMGAEGIDCKNEESILIADSPEAFLNKIKMLEEDSEFKNNITRKALHLIESTYSWQGQLAPLARMLSLSGS